MYNSMSSSHLTLLICRFGTIAIACALGFIIICATMAFLAISPERLMSAAHPNIRNYPAKENSQYGNIKLNNTLSHGAFGYTCSQYIPAIGPVLFISIGSLHGYQLDLNN